MELHATWKIKHPNSSSYKPKINGLTKTTNKNIKKDYSKIGGHLQRLTWDVTICPSCVPYYSQNFNKIWNKDVTLYSLVYGMETMMVLKVKILSLKIFIDFMLEEVE